MEKRYVITYTSIDNKAREFIWDLKSNYRYAGFEHIVNNIIQYVETTKWPEEPKQVKKWKIYYGLNNIADFLGRNSRTRELPNETQHVFFTSILLNITNSLGRECVKDKDFGKAIIKEAAMRAKEGDLAEVAKLTAISGNEKLAQDFLHARRDALTRAKARIRYQQNRYQVGNADTEFSSIVEEYNLFTILAIKPVQE